MRTIITSEARLCKDLRFVSTEHDVNGPLGKPTRDDQNGVLLRAFLETLFDLVPFLRRLLRPVWIRNSLGIMLYVAK